jgi:hypothetical protein
MSCKPCALPRCYPTCLEQVCKAERQRERAKWLSALRRRRVVGPAEYWTGRYAYLVEGWRPWPEEAAGFRVTALYVERDGIYSTIPDVDCWDEERDARLYPGPHPVVAHPPCGRWCAMARLNESRWGAKVGEDGGCFESALAAVRTYGGVLEHPASSLAWARFGLTRPPHFGWQRQLDGGWVCEVKQSAYGHLARKPTWLYYVGSGPAPADWRDIAGTHQVGGGVHTGNNQLPRLDSKRAIKTPPAFAEYLVALARQSRLEVAA